MAVEVQGGEGSRGFAPLAAGFHRALPAKDFYDPAILALERERIFDRKWICMGREEEMPTVGDFLVRELLGESLLLVRGRDSRARAFYNVCRHRGSRLCAEERGHLPGVIQCPYHAWTYSVEGDLVGTPNVKDGEGFDRADFPLVPLALEMWEGFLFVNLDPSPPPLAAQLGSEGPAYARYRLGDLKLVRLNRYECASNWKVIVENFNECLHCPTVHPELCEIMPLYRRGLVIEDDGFLGNRLPSGVTTWTRTGRSKVPPLPGLTDEDLGTYWGFVIFPTTFVNLLPNVVTYEILWPVTPDLTRVEYGFLFDPDEAAKPGFDGEDIIEFRDLIVRQDLHVCEVAQQGARCRGYRQGVLPPQDDLVYAFERQYLRERDGT